MRRGGGEIGIYIIFTNFGEFINEFPRIYEFLQTTFTWRFFQIIHIFHSIQPWSECNLSFLFIIIFQSHQSFEPLSSISGEDKHMRVVSIKNWFSIVIDWSIFKNQFFNPIIDFRSYMIDFFIYLWSIFHFFFFTNEKRPISWR